MKPTAKVGRGWYEYAYRDENNAPVSVMVPRGVTLKARTQTERDRLIHALVCIRTVVKIRRKNRERMAAEGK
ncbi:hypothetical protein [Burkholderia phage FLC6]|nr:hypothetical protein [Burkholderia phage FLC6]